MSDDINGIYVGYFTAAGGNGLAMFFLRDGSLAGADPNGVIYDGTYRVAENRSHIGRVRVINPPNTMLVQGASTGPNGLTYEADFTFPPDFLQRPHLRVETPLGPVNVALKKLRSI